MAVPVRAQWLIEDEGCGLLWIAIRGPDRVRSLACGPASRPGRVLVPGWHRASTVKIAVSAPLAALSAVFEAETAILL
jgi:hypothetical protein